MATTQRPEVTAFLPRPLALARPRQPAMFPTMFRRLPLRLLTASTLLLATLLLAPLPASADTPPAAPGDTPSETPAPLPDRIEVPEMKTSIYVGRVKMRLSTFARSGDKFTGTYAADVFPWSFWSEKGSIDVQIPEADLARLQKGETINFIGDAKNDHGKPRSVTGRATPASDRQTGTIKVRIHVEGVTLVFNGTYRFPQPQGN